jgi:predicted XRE-type DNA-binding protein
LDSVLPNIVHNSICVLRHNGHYTAGQEMRPVPGYPQFMVEDDLTIYRNGVKVNVGDQESDYIFIADGFGGAVKRATIICCAFHGPKPFPLAEVAHWDGNSKNDAPSNLRWATHSENIKDTKRYDPGYHVGERNGHCKIRDVDIDNILDLYKRGYKQREIAKIYGISQSHVSRIVRGEQRAIC